MTHEELVEQFYVDNHPTLAMYSPTLYRHRVKELLDKAAADETERCAKLARGWKDSCGERECGHTLDMVPEEIAAMIEDPSKNDSESKS